MKDNSAVEYQKKKPIINKISIGSVVTLPKHFTYGGHLFFVDSWFKTSGYRLMFVSGKYKGLTLERFSEGELIPINEKCLKELLKNEQ